MKRQIKFPLVIKSEQIRTMEDLRKNFDLESVAGMGRICEEFC